jgi:elongation factor Ts
MAYTAADVKKLRDETDAPMMECKGALEEAAGDFEKAKQILREKGKASAGKKAGRETNAGAVATTTSEDGQTIAIAIVESETDFVSNNEGFVTMVKELADRVLAEGTFSAEKAKEYGDEIIAKFRENCVVKVAEQLKTAGKFSSYVHHDRTKGAVVEATGDAAGTEAVRKVAVHIVASRPQVVAKSDLSQDALKAEFDTQYNRAINEGKNEKIAQSMAEGRVNKEFIKDVVLLEQPFYADQGKTVGVYLSEEAKGTTVNSFRYLSVGQSV